MNKKSAKVQIHGYCFFNVNGGKIFFLLLRFPLGGAADHLVCPESPFEHNKEAWTLGVKIKGESSAF